MCTQIIPERYMPFKFSCILRAYIQMMFSQMIFVIVFKRFAALDTKIAFMMIGVMLYCLYARFDKSERYMFIFLGVFFLYYLIFELLPVAGPYYYFKAIGVEAARQGIYPDLGNYFASHNELIHAEVRGLFSQLVHDIQIAGENPVGAFPSSHVGMSTVTMIVAWKTRNRWLFWCLTPFYLLLCIATVYIMAHYLIDSIAGFITACLFYWFMDMLYTFIHRKQTVQPVESL